MDRAARVSDDEADCTDGGRHISWCFCCHSPAVGAVIGEDEGVVCSIPGNQGRIVQARVNIVGGLRVSAVHFWPSDGWTSRSEALMETVTACENHGSSVADST